MNEKLRAIVAATLELDPSQVTAQTSVENQPKWDSLRHMNLIFAIEDGFDVRFADEQLPQLTSVAAFERALNL
ncbi:MAG: acyl carrier protein [Proteobacteria bacterium]|nr:acyl carrier protein [Pseudomonadota bacterium]MBS0462416.1 acyl carrier protein [Pseudomonadota bacterium]